MFGFEAYSGTALSAGGVRVGAGCKYLGLQLRVSWGSMRVVYVGSLSGLPMGVRYEGCMWLAYGGYQ